MKTGRGCGVEARARWVLSSGETITPSVFVPIAEQAGLIDTLSAWVLQSACATAYAWCGREAPCMTLSVYVSALQINHKFCGIIGRALHQSGFPAERLELEIPESALITNPELTIKHLHEWKQRLRVRISVDKFGMGYSSLGYLSRLPIDRLKLDRSLIHTMTRDPQGVAVVRSIVALATELGIDVIASGVESEEQLQILMNLGCPGVQGNLLGRAMSATHAQVSLRKTWGNRPQTRGHPRARRLRPSRRAELGGTHASSSGEFGNRNFSHREESPNEGDRTPLGNTPSVLYVDDDQEIRQLVEATLGLTTGLEVYTAGSGAQAIDRAFELRPDLILMDVMMPDMDGPATFKRIRSSPLIAAIPVIFVTAKVSPTDVAYLLHLGAIGVIAKPFDPIKDGKEMIALWKRVTGAGTDAAPITPPQVKAPAESLADVFLLRTRVDVATLIEFLDRAGAGDRVSLREVERVAHSIHGAGAMFGFPRLSTAAGAIEHLVAIALGTAPIVDHGTLQLLADQVQRLVQEIAVAEAAPRGLLAAPRRVAKT